MSERIGACLKEVGNWSKIQPVHKFDHADFSREAVLRDLEYAAPKLKALLDTIVRLDTEDLKRDNRVYKHFIYSDIKSSYGAKLIASGLAAYGFEHAYKLGRGARGMSFQIDPKVTSGEGDHRGKAFAVLTSVSFFEKNVGVNFRKELLRMYNARPDNVYGDKIRIIVLDSGFREGVDLFDVRYAHLFEPIATLADEKQAVGRVTRYCGQKGLDFHPMEGWPVQVYRYETEMPKAIRRVLYAQLPMLEPATNFFELFMKFSNIDPKKLNFANELADVSIRAAVDSVLTENIHQFKLPSPSKATGGASGTRSPGRKHAAFQERIVERYGKYKWPPVRIENGCTGAPVPSSLEAESSVSASASTGTHYRSSSSKASWYGSEMTGGAPVVLPFTPTQDFIRHYFTPSFKHSGMLLWHSVGTGKTCSAIATASSSFEKEGYSVIYVTRHTLKGDVWKNMFDQVCSVILQERLKKGMPLPELHAQRMRLLEKRWLEPMSYRQFSNALDGRSQLATELIKRNGRADPLRKTLVIIDEAHKLFAPDVAGSEKPDIDVIRKALDTSREVSGKDGVKLLFMTATPYTSQPMDLIRLLNLLRPVSQKFPEEFEAFAAQYLDNDGRFTETGKLDYWDAITGYISYLNREKDIRTFSYAKFHEVRVPMTNYEFDFLVQDIRYQTMQYDKIKEDVRFVKNAVKEEIDEVQREHAKRVKELQHTYKLKHEDCVDIRKVDYKLQEKQEKKKLTTDLEACNKLEKQCLEELRKTYETDKKALNEAAKAAIQALGGGAGAGKRKPKAETEVDDTKKETTLAIRKQLRKDLKKLADAYAFDKGSCKGDVADDKKQCIADAKKAFEARMAALPPVDVSSCDGILDTLKQMMEKETQATEANVQRVEKRHQSKIEADERRMDAAKTSLEMMQAHLEKMVTGDRSQRLRVEKCLGLKPAYQRALKEDPVITDVVIESGPVLDEALETAFDNEEMKKNLYLVMGHGSEYPESVSKRLKMPKDKILVVFPVCSRPNYMNLACKFIDAYKKKENHKLFADPLKNKDRIMSMIQQPMHIFLPGERVPNLSTDLFLAFKNPRSIAMAKSGVFRITNLPEINRERLPKSRDNLGSPLCDPIIGSIKDEGHYNNAVHHEMYKGNVYKPVQPKKNYTGMTSSNYTLQKIMGEVGPGVYYYIGCRSATQVPHDLYERILVKSEEQQKAPGRSARLTDLEKILLYHDEGMASPSPIASPTASSEAEEAKEKEKISPKQGERVLKDIKDVEKAVTEWEEKLVRMHWDDATAEMDGVDDRIVEWAKQLDKLRTMPLVELSDEEKERLRRKAILTNKKPPVFVTREVVEAAVERAVSALEFLAYIRLHLEAYESRFVTVTEGKEAIKLVRKVVYVHRHDDKPVVPRASLEVEVETLGYLPAKKRVAALKCDSSLLATKILGLMKKGIFPALPKTKVAAMSPGAFEALCKDVEMLSEI